MLRGPIFLMFFILFLPSDARASLAHSLDLTGNEGLLGTNIIVMNTGPIVVDGMTLDAAFQLVSAGGGSIHKDVDGMGAMRRPNPFFVDTSTDLNSRDQLSIWFLGFSSRSGGTPKFDGFTEFELSNLGDAAGESAIYRLDFVTQATLSDDGPHAIAGSPIEATFTVNGVVGPTEASFRMRSIDMQFSATNVTAIPEPISLGFVFVLSLAGLCLSRRRSACTVVNG